MIPSVSVLQGLLQKYSPTGDEYSAVNYLVNTMRNLGMESHFDAAGNAIGTRGSGPHEILLLGHIDTVSGEIPVRLEEGILYGRGSVDAKGPLAAFVCGASAAKIHPDWRITVIGAVGEEGDSKGAHYLCGHFEKPDLVIIGEPSGWEGVTLGYKGSCWVDFTFEQAISHTASGIGSVNDKAFVYWQSILNNTQNCNANSTKIFQQITPSIRKFSSTSEDFTEAAILHANFRLPPETLIEDLETIFQSAAKDSSQEMKHEIIEFLPAFLSEKNTPLVRAILAAIRQEGGKPSFKLKTGTSDMNIVGPAWNVPMVAYGPGDSNLDHTPSEHINVSEYLQGIEIITNTLEFIQDLK